MRRHHYRYIQPVLRQFTLTKTPDVGGSIFDLTDSSHQWTFQSAMTASDLLQDYMVHPDREWLLTDVPNGENMSFYGQTIEYKASGISINGLGNRTHFVYINNASQVQSMLNNDFHQICEMSFRPKSVTTTHTENDVVSLPTTTYPRYGYIMNRWGATSGATTTISNVTMTANKTVYALFTTQRPAYAPPPPANDEIYIGVGDGCEETIAPMLQKGGFGKIGLVSCERNTETQSFFIAKFKVGKEGVYYLPEDCFPGELGEQITAISLPDSVMEISEAFLSSPLPIIKSFTINSTNGIGDEKSFMNVLEMINKECIFYVPKGTLKIYSFIEDYGFTVKEFQAK